MRSTIHLVTADDCVVLRPLLQPVLDAELARHGEFAPLLVGVDLAPVLAVARALFAERPRTGPELRDALAETFPDTDARALAYACRNHLPLVQVPPRGLWGRTSRVTTTTVESWLGRPLMTNPSLDDVVLRYLGALGPGTVADASTWSRLTGLRAVFERLRPQLRVFRDERGRELFDLPEAPRPDPDTPAPVRFLPEYDNVLLSHSHRSRFYGNRERVAAIRGGRVLGTVLHDGTVCAVWRTEQVGDGERVVLEIERVVPLTKRATSAIAAEGRRFLRFLHPDAGVRDVRVVAAG